MTRRLTPQCHRPATGAHYKTGFFSRGIRFMTKRLLALALLNALTSTALADTAVDVAAAPDPAGATELDKVLVTGEITYRDRTDDTAPVLVYDLDYFQRFEPRTV